jgi:F-type H+-transporting ATPase subunit b
MISINATLIVQIINLLLLIFILNKVMYQPLRKLVAKRQQAIDDGLRQAKATLAQTQEIQSRYAQELSRGRGEISQKMKQMLQEHRAQSQAMIKEKQQEAQEVYAQLVEKIEAEMAQARQDIGREAEQVARSMATRILGRELS